MCVSLSLYLSFVGDADWNGYTQSGPDYYVEIDVVMDANTPLWKAHDLSQSLQDKIEVLPNVGRAFVHVDHETTHYPVRLASVLFPPLPLCYPFFRFVIYGGLVLTCPMVRYRNTASSCRLPSP